MITRLRRLRFRLRRGVAEQGLAATVRAGLRRFLGAEFEFVWYAAEPARIRRLRLREGYEFRIATEAEVTAWLTAVPAIDPSTGPNRIREGAWLCFILREGEPIFNCSVFTDRYPLDEVAGGWYALGDGVACVDDALTDRSARGLAIAPMAYAQIADRLESQGFEALITKVERDNVASRRTMEKVGFVEIGRMHSRRRWLQETVDFEPATTDLPEAARAAAASLAAALSR